jgi:hypothetical protein
LSDNASALVTYYEALVAAFAAGDERSVHNAIAAIIDDSFELGYTKGYGDGATDERMRMYEEV